MGSKEPLSPRELKRPRALKKVSGNKTLANQRTAEAQGKGPSRRSQASMAKFKPGGR